MLEKESQFKKLLLSGNSQSGGGIRCMLCENYRTVLTHGDLRARYLFILIYTTSPVVHYYICVKLKDASASVATNTEPAATMSYPKSKIDMSSGTCVKTPTGKITRQETINLWNPLRAACMLFGPIP